MMQCRQVQTLIDRYVSEGLLPDERSLFESHLQSCPSCQEQLHELRVLLALLRSAPAPPPVPEGFADRLMAKARQQVRPVPAGISRPVWAVWWRSVASPRFANAAGAVAAGLLLGIVMAQQTWRYSENAGHYRPPQASPEVVYELDFLSGSPGGSFADAYLNLTSAAGEQEI